MKLRIDNPIETLVGALVLAAAIGFAVYASSGRGDIAPGGGGYTVYALFQSANGVKVGSDVRIAGVKVGRVASVELDERTMRARVALSIDDPEVKLSDETFATVDSESLLGGTFIALDPIPGFETLADGGVITNTQGAVSLMGLISRFASGGGSAASGDGSAASAGGSAASEPSKP